MEDDSFGTINVFFKKIIDPPLIDRSLEFCSDLTYACSNHSVQHVELQFPSDNFTFLASSDRDIGKTTRYYHMIEPEGFWIGMKLHLPKSDIADIRRYCEDRIDDTTYDFHGLYCILFPWLASKLKRPNTHSCASFTFNALAQSAFFRRIVFERIFMKNKEHMAQKMRSPDPMIIYRILIVIKNMSFEYDVVSFINEQYIYDPSWMAKFVKNPIKSGDEEKEAQEDYSALSASEKRCLALIE